MNSSPSLHAARFGSLLRKFRRTRRADSFLAPSLAFGLGLCSLVLVAVRPQTVSAQSTSPIPATKAFDAPACSDVDLPGLLVDYVLGSQIVPSPYRTNPEWKAIILDPSKAANLQPPTILEGFVAPQANNETSKDQATAEVAEEDINWTHYTHDYTFKVAPDKAYQGLLSSYTRFPGLTVALAGSDSQAAFECLLLGGSYIGNNQCVLAHAETCPDGTTGTTCQRTDMEVEWDSASLMDVSTKEGSQRDWGAVPEFVWPTVNDRVWVSGRWIFDCGHPGVSSLFNASGFINVSDYVKLETEIHPPRALVTFRLNHTALDSFPFSRPVAPNFLPQSYLPVTGTPVDPATLPAGAPDDGPTNVPVTEADIFVSVNGGAANDLCSIEPVPCSGHTGPIIPVNDRNYVFDIYPPITDYTLTEANGTFKVFPPVADASLQWRVVDHSGELPLRACGTVDGSGCVTVDPIICLIDASTPPPTQSETGCSATPARPTRLRVILPFAGSNANYFAKSILVGWDDVPDPVGEPTPIVRTFQVRLHKLTVDHNGVPCCFGSGDWRVFVNVGGQYRYISNLSDTKANSGTGILQFNGGSNKCNGAPLTSNGDGDCYYFDNSPWTVSVQDGTPIHVAVGGFVARGVEDHTAAIYLCRTSNTNISAGCDPPTSFDILNDPWKTYATSNDDRIGTYEFDLTAPRYLQPNPFQTTKLGCENIPLAIGDCSIQYTVAFDVQEVAAATPPSSAPLVIGIPSYTGGAGLYFAASTPMIPQTGDTNVEGFQYRFHRQGAPLPLYATSPFPVHWAHVDLASGVHSAEVRIGGANSGDGPYDFQYSAESFANLLEPRHTTTVILDTTPPVATITQPVAMQQYVHSDMFTITYSVSDGAGSGVKSAVPNIDGLSTLKDGTPVALNQTVNLLTALALGTHTFNVVSTDNVNNTGTNTVTFSVIVTAESIKKDVTEFVAAGKITVDTGNSLLGLLDAAAQARAAGNCATANKIYQAFITQVAALSGKKIDPTAAQIMILDARYLMAHCP